MYTHHSFQRDRHSNATRQRSETVQTWRGNRKVHGVGSGGAQGDFTHPVVDASRLFVGRMGEWVEHTKACTEYSRRPIDTNGMPGWDLFSPPGDARSLWTRKGCLRFKKLQLL